MLYGLYYFLRSVFLNKIYYNGNISYMNNFGYFVLLYKLILNTLFEYNN